MKREHKTDRGTFEITVIEESEKKGMDLRISYTAEVLCPNPEWIITIENPMAHLDLDADNDQRSKALERVFDRIKEAIDMDHPGHFVLSLEKLDFRKDKRSTIKCKECSSTLRQIGPFARTKKEGEPTVKFDGYYDFECINEKCDNYGKVLKINPNDEALV